MVLSIRLSHAYSLQIQNQIKSKIFRTLLPKLVIILKILVSYDRPDNHMDFVCILYVYKCF